MSVLFTFPGQGAQRAGMLHALPDHPEVARTLREARRGLDADPLRLDNSAALVSTRAVQLCLLITGVAMARVLVTRHAAPDMVAGFSIGAWPAAVVAGALDFTDAVRLVALRGELMERAYPSGYGMAAIVGLDRAQVEAGIAAVHGAATPVYLANINAARQMVIAGSAAALLKVMQRAQAMGASRVERLAVAVPAHCELFAPAAELLRIALAKVVVHRPAVILLGSSSARALHTPERIADELAHNMARPVQWADTMQLGWERGARLALEMPTGSVLTRLATPQFGSGAISGESPGVDGHEATMGLHIGTLVARVRMEQARAGLPWSVGSVAFGLGRDSGKRDADAQAVAAGSVMQ